MNKKQDKISSLKKARAALDKRRKHCSSDAAPIYITFHHSDNLFTIDYPAHWNIYKEVDGSVQFSTPDSQLAGNQLSGGLMLFRVALPSNASSVIEKSGRFKEVATAMFDQVNSTNVRSDPTIIYSNYTADRPEEDQAGQRWFVLAADLVLGVSTSCSPQGKEILYPIFERMLSSLRVDRDDEVLAGRVLTRIRDAITASMPGTKIQIKGLTIKTERFEISITNLLAQIKRNPSQFDEIVDQFIQGTIGLSSGSEELGQETWETIRGRIQPLIKTDKYLQDANERTSRENTVESAFLISAPWLADLRICFALDDKTTFRFISNYDMQRWNVSLETLAEIAIENLEALPEPELMVMRFDDSEPAVAALKPHAGAASSYLLHPKLYQLASEKLGTDIAAAIPSRDALILFEYRGHRAALLSAVKQDFDTTNHPISDRLFRLTPDGIALL